MTQLFHGSRAVCQGYPLPRGQTPKEFVAHVAFMCAPRRHGIPDRYTRASGPDLEAKLAEQLKTLHRELMAALRRLERADAPQRPADHVHAPVVADRTGGSNSPPQAGGRGRLATPERLPRPGLLAHLSPRGPGSAPRARATARLDDTGRASTASPRVADHASFPPRLQLEPGSKFSPITQEEGQGTDPLTRPVQGSAAPSAPTASGSLLGVAPDVAECVALMVALVDDLAHAMASGGNNGFGASHPRSRNTAHACEEAMFGARIAALPRPLQADASRLVAVVCELDHLGARNFDRERCTSLTAALDLVIEALTQLHTVSAGSGTVPGGDSLAEQLHRESFVDVPAAAKAAVEQRLAALRAQVRVVSHTHTHTTCRAPRLLSCRASCAFLVCAHCMAVRPQARRRVMVLAVRQDLRDSVQSGSRVAVEACSAVAASLGLSQEVQEAHRIVTHMEDVSKADRRLTAALARPGALELRSCVQLAQEVEASAAVPLLRYLATTPTRQPTPHSPESGDNKPGNVLTALRSKAQQAQQWAPVVACLERVRNQACAMKSGRHTLCVAVCACVCVSRRE